MKIHFEREENKTPKLREDILNKDGQTRSSARQFLFADITRHRA